MMSCQKTSDRVNQTGKVTTITKMMVTMMIMENRKPQIANIIWWKIAITMTSNKFYCFPESYSTEFCG
jgi:hypothetical protein